MPGVAEADRPSAARSLRLPGPPRIAHPHLGREAGFGRADIFPMQHDLNVLFYQNGGRPRLLTQNELRWLLKLAFGPDERHGAIVRLVKP